MAESKIDVLSLSLRCQLRDDTNNESSAGENVYYFVWGATSGVSEAVRSVWTKNNTSSSEENDHLSILKSRDVNALAYAYSLARLDVKGLSKSKLRHLTEEGYISLSFRFVHYVWE